MRRESERLGRPATAVSARRPARFLISLAVLAVAIRAVMAVPQTRAAILDFFHLRGVLIERVDELPTVPINNDFNKLLVGERVTLEEREELGELQVSFPEALGDPRRHPPTGLSPGGMVSFVTERSRVRASSS